MIKLTNHYKNNKPVWINPSMIQSMEIYNGTLPNETPYTNIMMMSGQTYSVEESPEHIIELQTTNRNLILG